MRLPPALRPGRVLVIRPRGLGDVVLSTAVLAALARAYPGVPVDYLTESASGPLLETDPRIDRLFLFGRTRRDGRVTGGSMPDAMRWIWSGSPDLVIDLFSNPRTAILTAFSGARWRIGLDKRLRRFAYNVRVPRFHGVPSRDHRYAREVQLDFLRGAGISWEGRVDASVVLPDEDRAFARSCLDDLGYGDAPFGAVLPGGSWESKRWSPEGFAETARALARRFARPALVVWGPPEEIDAARVAELAEDAAQLAPPTTLRQMAAILGAPACLVSTDCLGRHLAIIQGVTTLGLFGTTDPRDWTPPEGHHRWVKGGKEEGWASLRELPGTVAVEELQKLLDEAGVDSSGADH